MPRARLLKPGFFTNEDLARFSYVHRLLYAGLWLLADKEGRLEDRPGRIKGQLFPYESIDVEPLLKDLAAAGFIERYVAVSTTRHPKVAAIAIPTFSKHQTPHHREAPSVIPPPKRAQGQPRARPVKARASPSVPVPVLVPVPVTGDPVPVPVSSTKDQSSVDAQKARAAPCAFGGEKTEDPAGNVKVITKIAHQMFDALGIKSLDVAEAVKEQCARLHVAYDSTVVGKAIDSARYQRTHPR